MRRYEDEAISAEFADRAKALLVRFNGKVVQGLASDAAARERLLGEVAHEYQAQVHDF